MTKFKSAVFGLEVITTLAMVLLSAAALITAEASPPAAPKMEAGSISVEAVQLAVNLSALPAQNFAAF